MTTWSLEVKAKGRVVTAFVDEEDYDWAHRHRWFVVTRKGSRKGEGGNSAHAARHGYRDDHVRTSVLMHREIFALMTGAIPDGHHVDHVDRDSFNNRRSNLRLALPTENGRNRRKHRGSLCPFKGVDLSRGRWRARIQLSPTNRLTIGYFTTAEAAARAYDRCAKLHFGAFAVLNFEENPCPSFAS